MSLVICTSWIRWDYDDAGFLLLVDMSFRVLWLLMILGLFFVDQNARRIDPHCLLITSFLVSLPKGLWIAAPKGVRTASQTVSDGFG